MRIITISREFGSGGRELGKRLADQLGFDYYDSEIISAVAKNSGMDAGYVEHALSDQGLRDFPITYRHTFGSSIYVQTNNVNLLMEQRRVIEGIAALGRDCIIVGRNADVILQQYHPMTLFVCATLEAKVARCKSRAPEGEKLTEKELIRKIKQIDKARAQTREILSGAKWGQRDAYHLMVNTTGWDMKELTSAVAKFAESWFERTV